MAVLLLLSITVKVTSPKVTDYTVTSQSISGTSKSLSAYNFDTANSSYAGVPGSYWVTIFAKDTAGNVSGCSTSAITSSCCPPDCA